MQYQIKVTFDPKYFSTDQKWCFWILGQCHSHQSSFLQQVFVFKVNEGSTYGKYIQVTKMSTTLTYFDHTSAITKMIRLQSMAHIHEL